jgi:pimeloyl-ACP methyl ester carboxylesterase
MGRPGLDWPSRLAEAWQQENLPPDSRESQFFDFFLRDRETLPLSALRQRLAAASPLYFADRLPPVQVHHGEADRPVPLRNVTLLRDRLSGGSRFSEVRVYPGAGHQLEDTPAFGIARMFLVEHLLKAPVGAGR